MLITSFEEREGPDFFFCPFRCNINSKSFLSSRVALMIQMAPGDLLQVSYPFLSLTEHEIIFLQDHA